MWSIYYQTLWNYDFHSLANWTPQKRETLMLNSEKREKQTQEWGTSAGFVEKDSKKNFEWKPIGPRSLHRLSSWDLGGISLYFFQVVKMSWRNSQSLWVEDTLLNFKVRLQAYPNRKLINLGNRKKNAYVVNWNLVTDAWLRAFAYNWGWLGESVPEWHYMNQHLRLPSCAL